MQINRAVPPAQQHKYYRGDSVKYAATYKIGNSTVHIVAPPPMEQEECEAILRRAEQPVLRWWNSLPEEKRLLLNKKWSDELEQTASSSAGD